MTNDPLILATQGGITRGVRGSGVIASLVCRARFTGHARATLHALIDTTQTCQIDLHVTSPQVNALIVACIVRRTPIIVRLDHHIFKRGRCVSSPLIKRLIITWATGRKRERREEKTERTCGASCVSRAKTKRLLDHGRAPRVMKMEEEERCLLRSDLFQETEEAGELERAQ